MWARKFIANNFYSKSPLIMVRRFLRDESMFVSGKTIKDLKEDLRIIMGVEKGYNPLAVNRNVLNKYLPNSLDELPPRSIKDSFLYAIIPLSTDENLQNNYISNLGMLRLGRLAEDLDIFAVMVLHKYILNPKVPLGKPYPYSIVTASVSSIHFTEFGGKAGEDVRISGHITCIGKTSATIAVWMEQKHLGQWTKITYSYVILAARDATNNFPCLINPLIPLNDKEKEVIARACRDREHIRMEEKASLPKALPTLEEQHIIHNLFLTGCEGRVSISRILPRGCKWMEKAALHSTVFSFPSQRNLHNTVFGGYIMRIAMELALALCMMYTQQIPHLIGISDISFKKPIPVGSIILMHAHVVYTYHNFIQITVFVDAVNRRIEMENTTNVIYLTYKSTGRVLTIVPYTYQESMMYIDGMRHFRRTMRDQGVELNSLYTPENINLSTDDT